MYNCIYIYRERERCYTYICLLCIYLCIYIYIYASASSPRRSSPHVSPVRLSQLESGPYVLHPSKNSSPNPPSKKPQTLYIHTYAYVLIQRLTCTHMIPCRVSPGGRVPLAAPLRIS